MGDRLPWKQLGVLALCALSVFALALLALEMTRFSAGLMVVWPGDGIILAFMLGPSRRRPLLVLLAGQLGAVAAESCFGSSTLLTVPMNLITALSLLGVYLAATQYLGSRSLIQSTAFLRFVCISIIGSLPTPILLAAVYSHLVHAHPINVFFGSLASKVVGCAVLTPMLLMVSTLRGSNRSPASFRGRRLVLLSYLVLSVGVFAQSLYPLCFLIPLGLMAVAYTCDLAWLAFAVLVTAVLAIAATLTGHGPISLMAGGPPAHVLMLQVFLSIITGTSLPVAALMNEHARLKSSLIAARVDAERANEAKSAFLATISHEIRTPLNGVLGMAQVIAMHELSPAQRERLGVISASGDALLSILNDVLDLSKIETGKLTLEVIEFDLGAVLCGAVQTYESLASDKGLGVTFDVAGAEGLYLGDPTRVRQILVNLIANAVKFTAAGGVHVVARRNDDGVRLSVQDTGIGIPEDKLDRLFSKFSQVDDSITRRFGGAGLGLSICKELSERMGGAISVESRDGEGSRFTVELPLRRVADSPAGATFAPTAELSPGVQRLRVLAAEDNPTNRLVLKTLLQSVEVEVELVEDGIEAVDAWARGTWDLVLMDVQMPRMDRPSATRAIRSREIAENRPRTRIIALTANTMSHQITEYLNSGMDAHLAKPIRAAELFQLLAATVAQSGAVEDANRSAA